MTNFKSIGTPTMYNINSNKGIKFNHLYIDENKLGSATIIPREQKNNNNFSKWLYTCFGLNAKRSYKKLKYYIKDKKKHDRNFRNLLQT